MKVIISCSPTVNEMALKWAPPQPATAVKSCFLHECMSNNIQYSSSVTLTSPTCTFNYFKYIILILRPTFA